MNAKEAKKLAQEYKKSKDAINKVLNEIIPEKARRGYRLIEYREFPIDENITPNSDKWTYSQDMFLKTLIHEGYQISIVNKKISKNPYIVIKW